MSCTKYWALRLQQNATMYYRKKLQKKDSGMIWNILRKCCRNPRHWKTASIPIRKCNRNWKILLRWLNFLSKRAKQKAHRIWMQSAMLLLRNWKKWNWHLCSPENMTTPMQFWRSTPEQAEQKHRTGQKCSIGCITAGQNGIISRWQRWIIWMAMKLAWRVLPFWLRAKMPMDSWSQNRVCIVWFGYLRSMPPADGTLRSPQ